MSVKIRIPPILQELLGTPDIVEMPGCNFRECLDELEIQFPGIKGQLYDKHGHLSGIYDIYVNDKSAYPNELSKPLEDGDVVSIVMLYMGG